MDSGGIFLPRNRKFPPAQPQDSGQSPLRMVHLGPKKGGGHMPFGQNVQRLRRAAGLSQEELAERLGVTRQAVSKWEREVSHS